MTLELAATELYNKLVESEGFERITAIGTTKCEENPIIFVYVKPHINKESFSAKYSFDDGYFGYPVVVKSMGTPQPL